MGLQNRPTFGSNLTYQFNGIAIMSRVWDMLLVPMIGTRITSPVWDNFKFQIGRDCNIVSSLGKVSRPNEWDYNNVASLGQYYRPNEWDCNNAPSL